MGNVWNFSRISRVSGGKLDKNLGRFEVERGDFEIFCETFQQNLWNLFAEIEWSFLKDLHRIFKSF